jgi:hypothetical protein
LRKRHFKARLHAISRSIRTGLRLRFQRVGIECCCPVSRSIGSGVTCHGCIPPIARYMSRYPSRQPVTCHDRVRTLVTCHGHVACMVHTRSALSKIERPNLSQERPQALHVTAALRCVRGNVTCHGRVTCHGQFAFVLHRRATRATARATRATHFIEPACPEVSIIANS